MSAAEFVAGPFVSKSATVPAECRQPTIGEVRRVTELVPHPGLVEYTRGYSTHELSVLSDRGEAAYADPLTIPHEECDCRRVTPSGSWPSSNIVKP